MHDADIADRASMTIVFAALLKQMAHVQNNSKFDAVTSTLSGVMADFCEAVSSALHDGEDDSTTAAAFAAALLSSIQSDAAPVLVAADASKVWSRLSQRYLSSNGSGYALVHAALLTLWSHGGLSQLC
jgi:hypothetical protein